MLALLVRGRTVIEGVVATQPAFRIAQVDHTGITVSSLERSLDFWVRVLGFEHLYTWTFENSVFIEQLVGVPGAAMRLAMVAGPGHNIELLEYSAPGDRTAYRPRSCDIGFQVTDMDALLERIAIENWHAVGEVQTVVDGDRKGLRLAYVRDPDGITLEFLQHAKDT
jgi:catechol 2,3-dioxygenase-like lactoylglutathione lyase family enzyme